MAPKETHISGTGAVPAKRRTIIMSDLGSGELPARVAVIGSGPAGFYAAEALLGSEAEVEVDMYEKLPAPFGLVRYGVAPDHAKIKKVISTYEKTAARPGFSYLGNVKVGVDISADELRRYYDAVIFTTGAQTDRHLRIPGENLPGSHAATEFVAWYNGHPEYTECTFDLSHNTAVVIGVGNVAVDVARILAKSYDELKETDIAEHALDVLAESNIRDVHLIGRRGPAQAKFTAQELKELGELEVCDLIVDESALALNPESLAELADPANKSAAKIYKILTDFAARPPAGKERRLFLHFLKSPIELAGRERVERVVLEHNRLTGQPGAQRSTGTGVKEDLECGILFRSVGYRGVPIPGLPFRDDWGIVPNEAGRVTDNGKPVAGIYVAGWIKRGPSGIIGTNKPDSITTVKNLLADLPSLQPCSNRDPRAVRDFLSDRGVRVVDYAAWQRIDAAEVERGREKGKPREKFVTVEELLTAAGI
jgi:ferredoxin--NADP+ reductase